MHATDRACGVTISVLDQDRRQTTAIAADSLFKESDRCCSGRTEAIGWLVFCPRGSYYLL